MRAMERRRAASARAQSTSAMRPEAIRFSARSLARLARSISISFPRSAESTRTVTLSPVTSAKPPPTKDKIHLAAFAVVHLPDLQSGEEGDVVH